MSDTCAACEKDLFSTDERATKLCRACARNLGVIPMPPARRRFAPCRCCNGMQFIRAIPREVAPRSRGDSQLTAPMAVTFGGKDTGDGVTTDLRRAFGLLEMYMCRGCGYVEWYCSDPENVPVGPEFMTELIEPAEQGPYR